MKISVIHGSQRNGNTEKTIQIVKSKLNSLENNDFLILFTKRLTIILLWMFSMS